MIVASHHCAMLLQNVYLLATLIETCDETGLCSQHRQDAVMTRKHYLKRRANTGHSKAIKS